jgi:hypothetical protein
MGAAGESTADRDLDVHDDRIGKTLAGSHRQVSGRNLASAAGGGTPLELLVPRGQTSGPPAPAFAPSALPPTRFRRYGGQVGEASAVR